MRLEIFGWVIDVRKGDSSASLNERAEAIRRAYEARLIDKINAVKRVRQLFVDRVPLDERGSLQGALHFVDRRSL